jgi:hypothetical protein
VHYGFIQSLLRVCVFSNLFTNAYIYIYISHKHSHCWVNKNDDNCCYELFHECAFLCRIFSKLQSRVCVVCLEECKLQNNVIKFSIHSLRSLFCDWSVAPTKTIYRQVLSRASYFKFRYHILSLKSYSGCLHFVPRLLVSYVLSFTFPSIT